jgi:hypothetical protein
LRIFEDFFAAGFRLSLAKVKFSVRFEIGFHCKKIYFRKCFFGRFINLIGRTVSAETRTKDLIKKTIWNQIRSQKRNKCFAWFLSRLRFCHQSS